MQIDFNEMEKKRQEKRTSEQIYKVSEDPNKEKFYVLDMFPYPSGAGLHVGHPKGYVATDVIARKKMLEKFSVLRSMGFDTFGLGIEQYAIDHKMKPQIASQQNIDNFKRQLKDMWFSYDWERSFSTADPDYYKRTQWIFLQLYTHYYDEEKKQARPISEYQWENPDEVRLAYIDYKPINRCPHCKTGLANEDLEEGRCERCGSEVEQRPMRQWVLRITKYADRLLEGLDGLDWDESMKELERNRIGKSSGTQFQMNVSRRDGSLNRPNTTNECRDGSWTRPNGEAVLSFEVFTTRIDTVFWMSFVVMAPEHALVDQITTDEYKEAVAKYKEQAKYKTQLERTELQKEKTGQFTGAYAINPFNNEEVPIFIGDYVLANYGTGVVMAVPAHDERDFEFAKKYDIPIKTSIAWNYYDEQTPPQEGLEETTRKGVIVLVKHRNEEKYICLKWKEQNRKDLITGGIEEGEEAIEAAKREVQEETWYKNFKEAKQILFENVDRFCAKHKGVNRTVFQKNVFIELADGEQDPIEEAEKNLFDVVWLTKEEMENTINLANHKFIFERHINGDSAYCDKGVLVNSWEFSGLTSDEAIKAMQKRLTERWLGGEKSNYKIQDWVFSRQRYWGEPFPVVFCKHCWEKALGGLSETWFEMQIAESTDTIKVSTTRIDAVFGVTFVRIAPTHPLANVIQSISSYAINPFSKEKVPLFVDTALTGDTAIMGIPAHDERDFEFAKKYDIPIKYVIGKSFWTRHEGAESKLSGYAFILDEDDKLLMTQRTNVGSTRKHRMIGGGIEKGETVLEGTVREIEEETGLYDVEFQGEIGCCQSFYFAGGGKNVWRENNEKILLFRLKSEKTKERNLTEYEEDLPLTRKTIDERIEEFTDIENPNSTADVVDALQQLKNYLAGKGATTGKGILIDSGAFSGLTSDEATVKMQKWLEENHIGGVKVWESHLHTINFYNQATWNGIKKKHKTIETRALNPEEPEKYFGNVKTGDILKMVNKETGEAIYWKITECYLWKSFEELFNEPELEKVYTDKEQFKNIKTMEQIKEDWNFVEGYVEKIEQNGLVGRKFELVDIAQVNPLPKSDLPLLLPDVENYEPTGREEGPLDDVHRWMKTKCPVCWNEAKRESNTMPGWAGSSWYRLRYMDPQNDKALVSKENEHYRGNVDVYVGGAEHVTRHMIYARFRQKFLYDIGIVSKQEPFQKYEKVWLIMAEDGRKMSKRRGNVVNPDEVIAEYGADAFRTYEMFMGPFDQFISWNTNGLKGVKKFLDKVIALWDKVDTNTVEIPKEIETLLHQTIKKTTEDIDTFRFNTTISQFMILVNKLTELDKIPAQLFETFIILLAPFAPHLAEEFWSLLGNEFSIFTKAKRPKWDEKKLTSDTVQLAIQFNGKVRGTVEVSPTASQEEVMNLIKEQEKMASYLASGEVKKVIYVPGKIMNIVIG